MPLWGAFQWDLPVWLTLTLISLAWLYALALIMAVTGDDTPKSKYLALNIGIVESISWDSQDSVQVELLVGTIRQRFTAPKAKVDGLHPGETVVFAYLRQGNAITRISAFVAAPGQISLEVVAQ